MIADSTLLELPYISLNMRELLPKYSGIYYVIDDRNMIWYIGQAKNINKRWQGKSHHRIYQLEAQKKQNFFIYYKQVNLTELDFVEKQEIEKYRPHLNGTSVKTKKVRPTETLLRETLAAISDFAFIIGIEPPRREIESEIRFDWLAQKKILDLSIIHIALDSQAYKEKFKIDSIEEQEALIKKIFTTRKVYANKWQGFPSSFPYTSYTYRLIVNRCVVEATWLFWYFAKLEIVPEFSLTTLSKESLRTLTLDSLSQLQEIVDLKRYTAVHLKRLKPYTSDLIKPIVQDEINSEAIKENLTKISQDYKQGKRGIGSRSKVRNIDDLLIAREIDISKYSYSNREGVIVMRGHDRIRLYIQCFTVNLKNPAPRMSNMAYTKVNDQVKVTASSLLDIAYLLASVDRKGWLLVEEYLQGFARSATELCEGEGYIKKCYISPRKFIVPAKFNIKFIDLGYSVWIPFGYCKEFPTLDTAKQEITQRLQQANLPTFKLSFTQEKVNK